MVSLQAVGIAENLPERINEVIMWPEPNSVLSLYCLRRT